MMDVSDGLLLDARRMAEASGCGAEIELDALPLSSAFIAERGRSSRRGCSRRPAATIMRLLAALPAGLDPSTLSLPDGTTIARIGALDAGEPAISARQRWRAGRAAGDTGL